MDSITKNFLLRDDLIPAIDISKWQGRWLSPELTKQHAKFLYMRGCNGYRQDKMLETYAQQARDHDIPFGLYIFVRPGKDAVRQANLLCDLHEKTGASLVPMVDVEYSDGKDRHAQVVHLGRVLGVIRERVGTPVIYTAAWYWNVHIKSIPNQHEYPLWNARYFDMDEGPIGDWRQWTLSKGKSVNIPSGWREYHALQFSADGNNWGNKAGFSSSHLDLNLVTPEFWEFISDGQPIRSELTQVSPPRFQRDLRRGARGVDVKALQAALKLLSPVDPGPIDGWFGPRTEQSLRAYQKARGLVVDGWAGDQTFGAITSEWPR